MKRSSLLSAVRGAANPSAARGEAAARSVAEADLAAADFAARGGGGGLTCLKAEDRRLWIQVAQTVRPLGRRIAAGAGARAGKGGAGQSEAVVAAGAEAEAAAVKAGEAAETSAAEAVVANAAKRLIARPEPGSEILRALRQRMLAEQAEKARQQARARIRAAGPAGSSAAPGGPGNAAAFAAAKSSGVSGGSAADKAAASPAAAVAKAPAGAKAKAPPMRGGLDTGSYRKLARGRLPIEARLDLHNYTQTEAHDALLYFIRRAYAGGKRHVLIITGKGLTSGSEGILRGRLPYWLAQPPFRSYVAAMESAARAHGGEGAFYVRLRRIALEPADQ